MKNVQNFVRYCVEQVSSTRVLRYLIAGGTVAVINFVILYMLTDIFYIWYLTSSLIALSIAVILSFILQKYWTFRNHSLDHVHVQLPLHLLLSLANIVLNTVLMFFFVEQIRLWYITAQFFAAAMLACMNFFVYRQFIFAQETHRSKMDEA